MFWKQRYVFKPTQRFLFSPGRGCVTVGAAQIPSWHRRSCRSVCNSFHKKLQNVKYWLQAALLDVLKHWLTARAIKGCPARRHVRCALLWQSGRDDVVPPRLPWLSLVINHLLPGSCPLHNRMTAISAPGEATQDCHDACSSHSGLNLAITVRRVFSVRVALVIMTSTRLSPKSLRKTFWMSWWLSSSTSLMQKVLKFSSSSRAV